MLLGPSLTGHGACPPVDTQGCHLRLVWQWAAVLGWGLFCSGMGHSLCTGGRAYVAGHLPAGLGCSPDPLLCPCVALGSRLRFARR